MRNKNITKYIQNAVNNYDFEYIKNLYYYNRPAFQHSCCTQPFYKFITHKIENANPENYTNSEIMMWDTFARIHVNGIGILPILSHLPLKIKEEINKIPENANSLNNFAIYWRRNTNLFGLIGFSFVTLTAFGSFGMSIGVEFLEWNSVQTHFIYLTLFSSVCAITIALTSNISEIVFNLYNEIKGPYSLEHIINNTDQRLQNKNHILSMD